MKNILVTGAAGFIGAALVKRLLQNGDYVVGLDNLNSYYDPKLKKSRLTDIDTKVKEGKGSWHFHNASIEKMNCLDEIFHKNSFDVVVNLAAQAGVRYSITNPSAYVQSNLVGFSNIMEQCRKHLVKNFIYASSSSVYGGNKNLPFREDTSVDHPISLYASTKKANELIAHSYSHLYDIPSTGLRFFTVYGPWGRPDMAPMLFADSIIKKKPINVFNYGKMKRDFTYIDDIVEGIFRCCKKPATKNQNFNSLHPSNSSSFAPYKIFNIGNSKPINLLYFINLLEEELGIKAIKNFMPIQPGDVESTAANTDLLNEWIDFKPLTPIEVGIQKFSKWFKEYYLG
tara:strand:- start:2425 stop:3450 length:1026 start_codon:yes stop_codon:yes gene_type:complete